MKNKLNISKSPVIPAILSSVKTEFERRLNFAEELGAVHLDVMDGRFCVGQALPVDEWPDMANVAYSEAHLMVVEPMQYLDKLAAKSIRRAIVHVESKFDLVELRNAARQYDILLGFAINPDTDLFSVKHYFEPGSYLQVMGVMPGKSGQSLIHQTPSALRYIAQATLSRLTLTVDGGVNDQNAAMLKAAGADYLIASSAIYKEKEPLVAYKALLAALENNGKA